MHAESTVNGFVPPARLPVSYLPPPYGSCRGGVDATAWNSEGAVHRLRELSVRRVNERKSAMRGVTCAADFGHDNLAWSGARTRSGRDRIMAATFGGGLLGAAVVALLGMVDVGRPPHIVASEHAPVAGHVLASAASREHADTAPARASHILLTGQIEKGLIVEQTARTEEERLDEPITLTKKAAPARLEWPSARSREPVGGIGTRDVVRSVRARSSPHAKRHAPPDVEAATSTRQEGGADDWPSGEALKSMRIELKSAEASLRLRESAERQPVNTVIHLEQHIRLTDD
ncbi:hypothetical protein [Burkholderia stabilis]|uniref:hypothetical protein n=1 Tax=Burkholderia stabilis TaxID=95485 RepID=UPI001F4B5998|nr:hypothetical protein [Burkholderia stabilis]